MPKLTVEGITAVEVQAGKRLINALSEEAGTDQLHNCGGHAKCTSCRVIFTHGEPAKMTVAEKELLGLKGLLTQPGLRLSCQITCEADMSVKLISRLEGSGRPDTGKPTAAQIEPPPVWTTRE